MPPKMPGYCCNRPILDKEIHLRDSGLDQTEFQLLQVSRWFFVSYSQSNCAWENGFIEADAFFGPQDGPRLASQLMRALQVMRATRQSTFRYSNPACPDCAVVLTEFERRLFRTLGALRMGRLGCAQAELMMLCEGNPIDNLLSALQKLANALPDRAATETGFFNSEGIVRHA